MPLSTAVSKISSRFRERRFLIGLILLYAVIWAWWASCPVTICWAKASGGFRIWLANWA